MIKRFLWNYTISSFFVLHSLSMSMGWKYRSWPPHVSEHNFLSVDNLSNVTAAYLVFVWHTVYDDLFQMVAFFYTVEQCSAINNLSIASDLQLFKSGLCNLKTLCYIRRHAKRSLVLSECLCYQLCLSSSQCFAMIALLQTLQKALFQGSRYWANFKFWILQPYMSKLLAALLYQEVFFHTLLLTSVTESLGNIVPWDKNIFSQCFLLT